MSAVLVGSMKEGKSSWVFVRDQEGFSCVGMEKLVDLIQVTLKWNKKDNQVDLFFREDTVFKWPEKPDMVQVTHVKASGSPVSVDLE